MDTATTDQLNGACFSRNCGIEDIHEFSTLTRNGLIKIGVTCRSDLLRLSLKDLYRIDFVGKVGRQSIISYFQDHNLQFNSVSFFKTVN